MQFTAVVIVFTALFNVARGQNELGPALPTKPSKCDLRCIELGETICASNGICLNIFPSKCQMLKYNCLFPEKIFSETNDWKCSDRAMALCSLGDL